MKKELFLAICSILLVGCGSNIISTSNQTQLRLKYFYLNEVCQSPDGESIKITDYQIRDNYLILNGLVKYNVFENGLPHKVPSCLNGLNSFAENEHIVFNSEQTHKSNGSLDNQNNSFEGNYSFVFEYDDQIKIENTRDLVFNFYITEQDYVYSFFVLNYIS